MEQIFRWKSESGVHEYRFTDGICDGFFSNDVEGAIEMGYKGKPITDMWLAALPEAGFIEVTPITNKDNLK